MFKFDAYFQLGILPVNLYTLSIIFFWQDFGTGEYHKKSPNEGCTPHRVRFTLDDDDPSSGAPRKGSLTDEPSATKHFGLYQKEKYPHADISEKSDHNSMSILNKSRAVSCSDFRGVLDQETKQSGAIEGLFDDESTTGDACHLPDETLTDDTISHNYVYDGSAFTFCSHSSDTDISIPVPEISSWSRSDLENAGNKPLNFQLDLCPSKRGQKHFASFVVPSMSKLTDVSSQEQEQRQFFQHVGALVDDSASPEGDQQGLICIVYVQCSTHICGVWLTFNLLKPCIAGANLTIKTIVFSCIFNAFFSLCIQWTTMFCCSRNFASLTCFPMHIIISVVLLLELVSKWKVTLELDRNTI